MAIRKVVKKSVSTAKRRTRPAAKSAATAPINVARKMVLAGLGAAERAAERVQGNAGRVVGAFTRETGRIAGLTAEAAQTMTRKANVFVREGQKVQSNVQAAAEAKAREVAGEIRAFAAKSERTFKRNMKGTVNATAANANESITRLEQVFEARVARTLNTFGIPSSQNVRELQARMSELQKALSQLSKRGVRA